MYARFRDAVCHFECESCEVGDHQCTNPNCNCTHPPSHLADEYYWTRRRLERTGKDASRSDITFVLSAPRRPLRPRQNSGSPHVA